MTTDDTITIGRSAAGAPARSQRRTLGKGLGALLGEAAEDYSQLDVKRTGPAGPITKLGIDLLAAGLYQPRRTFTPESLRELADSIREKGILQPILVRPHVRPNMYEIIAGERRWRAALDAGLHEVPVIVREMTDAQAAEAALIENVQREDLSIIEEAQAYQRLVTDFKHRQEDVARLVGKSRAYIANTLRLLKLPQNVQDKVNSGMITAGHARALLSVSDDPDVFEKMLSGGKMSVREAEAQVQALHGTDYRPAKGKLRDANTVALEKAVADMLGLRVKIAGRAQKGSLTINYQTLEQLDDVLRKLCGGKVQV